MVKRIAAMLMAVMLVWTMVPAAASAAEEKGTDENVFTYRIRSDGNLEITGYTGDAAELEIPSKLNGGDVVSIGDRVFKSNTALQKVVIPESVTGIGDAAFSYCTSLESIVIPAGTTNWGDRIFYCSSALKSVEIPNGIKRIGDSMFFECTGLQSIKIPATVKSIGDSAFSNNASLAKIYYTGSEKDWDAIAIGTDNAALSKDKISYEGGAAATQQSADKKVITGCAITVADPVVYTGAAVEAAVTVTDGTKTLTKGTDYTLSYKDNNKVGTATVTITGAGDYTGSVEKSFTIKALTSLEKAVVTLKTTSCVYDGKAKEPAVDSVKLGTTILKEKTDYTVSYKDNIKVGTATVTITGTGIYTGTATQTFKITEAPVSLAKAVVTLAETSCTYDGKAKEPAVKSVVLDKTTLKSGTDYKVTYKDNIKVGTATATVSGTGSYTGAAITTFKIEAASLKNATASIETRSYTYDGTAKQPKVSAVKLNGTELKEGTDYTVSYKDNTEIGTGAAEITGKGNYTGTLTKIFLIMPENAPIDDAAVTLSKNSYTYNGKAKKPTVTVQLGGIQLNPDTDYEVSYKDNKNIGTASVTITGKGVYSGTATTTFEIKAKAGTVFYAGSYKYKVIDSGHVSFTGFKKNKTQKVSIRETVKYGGKNFDVTAVAAKALKGTNATSIVVGDNVETIGKSAFEGCKKLKSVTLGAQVSEIGAKAFMGCGKLAKITIQSPALESVGKKAFSGIKSTARIHVPSDKLEEYKELLQGKGQGKKVKIK